MGGFFGVVSKRDCLEDLYFGTDYHSHLGTNTGGIAIYDEESGLQREIHRIKKTPFRTKFEKIFEDFKGTSGIGCINDSEPQPLIIRSNLGTYALCVIGVINNKEDLINKYLSSGGGHHFATIDGGAVNTTELVAAMINQKDSFVEGILFASEVIEGTASILILKSDGNIIVARDKVGRLPVLVGKCEDGYAVALESFSYHKLGYEDIKELGPGEIGELSVDGYVELSAPHEKMRICSFLWSYYGYPTSTYEGVNVEMMRCRNGQIMARDEKINGTLPKIDYVGGVPDSGTPHAIGYANESGVSFARPYIKYSPTWQRSFMPNTQRDRSRVAKMKQIPIHDLIEGKSLMMVDDSIVRGTQLKETAEFLYENKAKAVHMRSACPPIMYACKYLNFSRNTSDVDLITRRVIIELEGEEGLQYIDEYRDSSTDRGKRLRQTMCDKLGFDSLEFQTLQGLVESIGIEECKLCTYCWNGRE